MTPSNSDFSQLAERIRGIDDLGERYREIRQAETAFKTLVRTLLQEVAQGLKNEGKTWPEVAQVMGGVTYQRAHQISRGE